MSRKPAHFFVEKSADHLSLLTFRGYISIFADITFDFADKIILSRIYSENRGYDVILGLWFLAGAERSLRFSLIQLQWADSRSLHPRL